jgi:hypothetical protein
MVTRHNVSSLSGLLVQWCARRAIFGRVWKEEANTAKGMLEGE